MWVTGRPTGMVRTLLALALIGGALSSCAGSEGSASCIAALEVDGNAYYGRARPDAEIPTTGEEVDAVIPGCNDTGREEPDEEVRVELIRDVPAGTAVVFQDDLYVRGGVQLPAAAGDWYPSVSCRAPGEFTLRGRLGGLSEPYQPYVERDLEAPYEVDLLVDGRRFPHTVLDVQVTAETESGLTDADRDRRRVGLTVTARCDNGEFVAVSVQVE